VWLDGMGAVGRTACTTEGKGWQATIRMGILSCRTCGFPPPVDSLLPVPIPKEMEWRWDGVGMDRMG